MLRLLGIFISLFLALYLSGCSKKPNAENIYESKEYKLLTRKELIVGESIWATSCFRCHRYGTNGAVVAENKKYWDNAAEKGIDELCIFTAWKQTVKSIHFLINLKMLSLSIISLNSA